MPTGPLFMRGAANSLCSTLVGAAGFSPPSLASPLLTQFCGPDTKPRTDLVQPPAVQQGGQLVQTGLRGVQQVLDAQKVSLRAQTLVRKPGHMPPQTGVLSVCDTSAVGNSGTANCRRPWIWICMVVRDLWKMVKGCEGGTTEQRDAHRQDLKLGVHQQSVMKTTPVVTPRRQQGAGRASTPWCEQAIT